MLRGSARGHKTAGHSVRGGDPRAVLPHPPHQHTRHQAGTDSQSVLRIRDVYPGFEFFHPRSRIQRVIKATVNLSIFNPKNCYLLSSRKYDPLNVYLGSRILDPRVKKAQDHGSGSATLPKGTGSRIQIRNTAVYHEALT